MCKIINVRKNICHTSKSELIYKMKATIFKAKPKVCSYGKLKSN